MHPLTRPTKVTAAADMAASPPANMAAALPRANKPFARWPKILELPTHLMLPAVSYGGLAGVVAGSIKLLGSGSWMLIGGCVGTPLLLVIAQLAAAGGPGVAKSMNGKLSDDARLQDLARAAALAVGVDPPQVYEVPSREPNAFAASGLLARDTTVAVTTGLREILSDEELGAVLSHEMAHLRHRDVVRNMHVAAAAAGFAGLYDAGRALLDSSGRSKRRKKKGDGESGAGAGIALMGAGLACQGIAHVLRLAASRSAELKADAAAAEAFGAMALIRALRKIEKHAARRPADLRSGPGRAYAFLMINGGPHKGKAHSWIDRIGRALRTHPPTDERIAALEKAVYDGVVPSRAAAGWRSAW